MTFRLAPSVIRLAAMSFLSMSAAFVGGSAGAAEIRNSRFAVGDWKGAAYTGSGSSFSHCGIEYLYSTGTSLHFSVDRAYKLRAGLSNPKWRMKVGQISTFSWRVDAQPVRRTRFVARDPRLTVGELPATEAVFNALRTGARLTMQAGTSNYGFPLVGTSAALTRLLSCARHYTNGGRAPDMQAPRPAAPQAAAPEPFLSGFAERAAPPRQAAAPPVPSAPARVAARDTARDTARDAAPAGGGAGEPVPVAEILNATRVVANLLATPELRAYRLAAPGQVEAPALKRLTGDAAVVFASADGTGIVHIFPAARTGASLLAEAVGADATACAGSFSSGRGNAEGRPPMDTAMTRCETSSGAESRADYLVTAMPGGFLYRYALIQTGADIDPQAGDALARAVRSEASR